VSNYGSFGTRHGVPLIRPPAVGIVGVGRVHEAVVAVDGQPAVRPILPLAVSTDHRLNDGDHLAAFAATVEAYLADPALLLVS
jgi:pyruvate dehydrogenase E2 component (dihydrolipoamide acetyltransferase)